MIKITKTGCNFEREPLLAPFGFKGKYVGELWQTAALVRNDAGDEGIGLGTQSILWSDAQVFDRCSPSAGNSMMFLMTEFALQKAREEAFETPVDLLDRILPETYEYGKKLSGIEGLRTTFALNALVAVDNAAWILYCREKGIESFDDMIPSGFRSALPFKHDRLASIPLVTYGVRIPEIEQLVRSGHFFLKIKIGSDPERDGDPEKMLEWDKRRLSAIHEVIGDIKTEHADSGYIPYYLDANGRYGTRDLLLRFLEHADSIGALDRILLLEEPFPEDYRIDVHDVPVRLAADESAHSDRDALERIELGYGAIALKPIAKTLSMSLKIAKIAQERGVPCFCADLTVNPILVDWNKNVAARLAPLPGLKTGVLEANGHQNYGRWQELTTFHPHCGATWTMISGGMYELDAGFYGHSGGIFDMSGHYASLVR